MTWLSPQQRRPQGSQKRDWIFLPLKRHCPSPIKGSWKMDLSKQTQLQNDVKDWAVFSWEHSHFQVFITPHGFLLALLLNWKSWPKSQSHQVFSPLTITAPSRLKSFLDSRKSQARDHASALISSSVWKKKICFVLSEQGAVCMALRKPNCANLFQG